MNYYTDDKFIELVEWLELLKVQGFSKVIAYIQTITPRMRMVLERYKEEGFVEILPFSYPGLGTAGDPRWFTLKNSLSLLSSGSQS